MISKPPNEFRVKENLTGRLRQHGFFYIAPEPKTASHRAEQRNPQGGGQESFPQNSVVLHFEGRGNAYEAQLRGLDAYERSL